MKTAALMGTVAMVGVMLGVAGTASAARDGYSTLRTPITATAGKPFAVSASIGTFDTTGRPRTCRLTLKGPKGKRIVAAKRVVRGDARIGWRVTVGLLSPGRWTARLACDRISATGSSVTVEAARRALAVSGAQLVRGTGEYSSSYSWAAMISNPSGAREYQDVDLVATLRDAAGRVVATDKSSSMTIAAGASGWVGGETTVSGEIPASVSVSAIGGLHPPGASRAFAPVDVRAVLIPPSYEGDTTDLRVRGEARNPNPQAAAANIFVTVFDGNGALIGARRELVFGVAPGASEVLDRRLGPLGALVPARIEFFAPVSD